MKIQLIEDLIGVIRELTDFNSKLPDLPAKNSQNSSRPPSGDGLRLEGRCFPLA
ncbi:MAG: hypothetical protein GY795_05140 [Desulfobacterales bacterium]|nr:hypothetical protein [Desulfobacterales bacterium]